MAEREVFCLKVAGEPEYFANGILVHNCDELAAWKYLRETWDMAMFGLRLGDRPRTCITTTPKPLPLVKEIAKDADLVIVVGSGNSSNSVRLVEVALEAGARASYRVDDASEIQESWLEGVRTVSVTSGASVPEELVQGVLSFLAERGYPDARAVHSAEESLIFALPKELRRDLKAAGRS